MIPGLGGKLRQIEESIDEKMLAKNKAIIQSIGNTIAYLGEEKVQKNVLILRKFLKERENERI